MARLKSLFKIFLILFLIFSTNEAFASYDKLNKKNYEYAKNEKAVVIYGVNWGRHWGCAGIENAQLYNLVFSRIDSNGGLSGENIILNTPGKLLSKNVSESYAIIVNPGEYALTGFDIKIAKSSSNISHIKAANQDLLRNGKVSGSFIVNPGEIVYIGDFGLDCFKEPIPWRYYIQREDFESYIAGLKKKYKFIADKSVIYRLFQTNMFGQEEGKR